MLKINPPDWLIVGFFINLLGHANSDSINNENPDYFAKIFDFLVTNFKNQVV